MDSTALHMAFSLGRKVKRYSQFLLVGTVNAAVDLGVLNFLMAVAPSKSTLTLSVYNSIAVMAAIFSSYILNRRITFSDVSTGSLRERVMFILQGVVNVGLNDLTMVWMSTYLVNDKALPVVVGSNLGKALAMLISSTASYLLMRFIVFRKTKGQPR